MDSNFTIWRDSPARQFTDALPLGNGRLGAMVYGNVQEELIQLNEDTLWSGVPRTFTVPQAADILPRIRKELMLNKDWKQAQELCRKLQGLNTERFQPLGNIHITTLKKGTVQHYRHLLSFPEAQTSTTFDLDGLSCRRDVFCSYPDQVIVIRITAEGHLVPDCKISLDSCLPFDCQTDKNKLTMTGRAPSHVSPDNQPEWDPQNCLTFAAAVVVKNLGGTVTPTEKRELLIAQAEEITLLVTAATSFNGFAKHPTTNGKAPQKLVDTTLARAKRKSFDDLLSRHRADIMPLFTACDLDLGHSPVEDRPTIQRVNAGDKTLPALLFNYGRYLMLASSRAATQPALQQGIWNESITPHGNANYTLNVNTEMNYWPNGPANLLECDEPLLKLLEDLRKTGSLVASVNYGCKGWCAHRNTDLWRLTCPDGDFGNQEPKCANWPMGGLWLSLNLWEHVAFSADAEFLRRKAWPIMKGAAQFALDWLVTLKEQGTEYLVTAPATSPENDFLTPNGTTAQVAIATTCDMSIIKELFTNCLTAAKILNLERDATVRAIRKALPKLFPFQIGKRGQLQEWAEDWDSPKDHHSHLSHCLSCYPGKLITIQDTPELAQAVKQSLDERENLNPGWSAAWKLCLRARLKQPELARKIIQDMITPADPKQNRPGLCQNLWHTRPPFQIDANFGLTAGIAEMLVQSHRTEAFGDDNMPRHVIDILPALPQEWPQGTVKGLRARGGYKLDLTWNQGKLTRAIVKPELDSLCLLEQKEPMIVKSAGQTMETVNHHGLLAFPVTRGHEYTLTPITSQP